MEDIDDQDEGEIEDQDETRDTQAQNTRACGCQVLVVKELMLAEYGMIMCSLSRLARNCISSGLCSSGERRAASMVRHTGRRRLPAQLYRQFRSRISETGGRGMRHFLRCEASKRSESYKPDNTRPVLPLP